LREKSSKNVSVFSTPIGIGDCRLSIVEIR
jgi:hypothetical protein